MFYDFLSQSKRIILLKYIFLFLLVFDILEAKSNALISETSPYLQRHAHNPVNWYAWNKITLDLAKKQNKPIFLSIGYSTCHWCHVMEEESFEQQDVADVLNKYFISIKVDKEEFPNIDKKYQNLFRAFKGQRGGWPLSVFLTPELESYFITTYIPRASYAGAEDIISLAKRLGRLYRDQALLSAELKKFAKAKLFANQAPKPSKNNLKLKELVKIAVDKIEGQYDKENTGFATGRTKFPEASKLELLLNIYKTTGNKKAFDMARETLLTMSKRGIYDQVDGGFFRYSGKNWTIPHFQKLLYVNAQMPLPYLEIYRITGDKYFYKIAKESIDEMQARYMGDALYFSASDSVAKTGNEGDYYLYMYDEVKKGLLQENLNKDEIDNILEYLSIEELGNYDSELAHINIMEGEAPKNLELAKAYLRKVRRNRDFPVLDKKIITSWNAMMIKTLYVLAKYDSSYEKIANDRLDSLLSLMLKEDTLYHQTIAAKPPSQKAQLEDYAYLIDALLTAHQVTLEKKHLKLASRLAYKAKELFEEEGVWYMSNEIPKVRADFDDKYYSSPLSILLNGFVTLANIHDDMDLMQESERMIKVYGNVLEDNPEESSSFMTLALRLKAGVVTLKAQKKALDRHREEFAKVDYPFLLRKDHSFDEYMACKLGLCFATSKNFKDIAKEISKIKNEINIKPKKMIWGKD